MEKDSKPISRIDNALNRRGRPLNPNSKQDMRKALDTIGSVTVEAPKDQVRVILDLGPLDQESVLDLEDEDEAEEGTD
jgi:hypothetical protein